MKEISSIISLSTTLFFIIHYSARARVLSGFRYRFEFWKQYHIVSISDNWAMLTDSDSQNSIHLREIFNSRTVLLSSGHLAKGRQWAKSEDSLEHRCKAGETIPVRPGKGSALDGGGKRAAVVSSCRVGTRRGKRGNRERERGGRLSSRWHQSPAPRDTLRFVHPPVSLSTSRSFRSSQTRLSREREKHHESRSRVPVTRSRERARREFLPVSGAKWQIGRFSSNPNGRSDKLEAASNCRLSLSFGKLFENDVTRRGCGLRKNDLLAVVLSNARDWI